MPDENTQDQSQALTRDDVLALVQEAVAGATASFAQQQQETHVSLADQAAARQQQQQQPQDPRAELRSMIENNDMFSEMLRMAEERARANMFQVNAPSIQQDAVSVVQSIFGADIPEAVRAKVEPYIVNTLKENPAELVDAVQSGMLATSLKALKLDMIERGEIQAQGQQAPRATGLFGVVGGARGGSLRDRLSPAAQAEFDMYYQMTGEEPTIEQLQGAGIRI